MLFYINYFEKYNVSALKSVVRNAILHNVVINWKKRMNGLISNIRYSGRMLIMFYALFSVGSLSMIAAMICAGRIYKVSVLKCVISALLLTVIGLAGANLMNYIETGFESTSGKSFFGALFLVPALMPLAAKMLKIKTSEMLDMCSPCGCVIVTILKINCYISGCCFGRIIYRDSEICIRFPSQIVESVTALILMFILFIMMKKGKYRDVLYPWYMILYGIIRFFLNLLRETKPLFWILPGGNFWSLIAIATGLIWLYLVSKKRKNGLKKTDSATK